MSDALANRIAQDVRLAAEGNVEAFGRLMSETRSLVCAITLAITRNIEDSEDVAQDVYLATWRSLPKLRNPESFLPWVRQIARNLAKAAIRSRARQSRGRVSDPQQISDSIASLVDVRPRADQFLLAAEERMRLEDVLARLPDETREIVTLYYREDQSVSSVAELLELSPDTVKKRLQRARMAIRLELLTDAGAVLKQTAPGSALTLSVLTAISVAAPSGASASALGLGACKAGGWTISKLLGAMAGTAAGIVGGVGAFIWADRLTRRRIRNVRDRNRLCLWTMTGALHVFLSAFLLPWGFQVWHSIAFLLLWYLGLVGGMAVLMYVWLPSIMRATLQAELECDQNAAVRHRKERLRGYAGFLVGVLLSGAAIAWIIVKLHMVN